MDYILALSRMGVRCECTRMRVCRSATQTIKVLKQRLCNADGVRVVVVVVIAVKMSRLRKRTNKMKDIKRAQQLSNFNSYCHKLGVSACFLRNNNNSLPQDSVVIKKSQWKQQKRTQPLNVSMTSRAFNQVLHLKVNSCNYSEKQTFLLFYGFFEIEIHVYKKKCKALSKDTIIVNLLYDNTVSLYLFRFLSCTFLAVKLCFVSFI